MCAQRVEKGLRSVWSLIVRIAPFFVGYGCLDGWWQMISADILVLAPAPYRIIHYLFALLPPAVFILVSGRVAPLVRRRYREVLYLFGFAATFGTFTLYLVIGDMVDPQFLPGINALLGVARACLLICWLEKLTTLRIADMWAAFGCAIVVGAIVGCAASAIPPYPQAAVFCILPLVSTVLLQIRHRGASRPANAERGEGGAGSESGPSEPNAGARLGFAFVKRALPAVPFLLVVVLGLVDAPSEALVVIEHGAGLGDVGPAEIFLNALQRMLVNLVAVTLAFLAVRKNSAFAFYVAVPLIAFAAFFLALGYSGVGVFHAASRIGSETIHYIVVYLLFCAVRERTVPALFCFSLMELLHNLGALLGFCAGTVLAESRTVLALTFLLILMAAMLVLLAAQQRGELVPGVAYSAAKGAGSAKGHAEESLAEHPAVEHPAREHAAAEGALAESAAAEPPLRDAADPTDAFAAQYGLSARESSVMGLWVKGHTTAFIAEQLCVSKHTVKTHVNHIYEKTGANSKESLILLFEQFCSSEGASDE